MVSRLAKRCIQSQLFIEYKPQKLTLGNGRRQSFELPKDPETPLEVAHDSTTGKRKLKTNDHQDTIGMVRLQRNKLRDPKPF